MSRQGQQLGPVSSSAASSLLINQATVYLKLSDMKTSLCAHSAQNQQVTPALHHRSIGSECLLFSAVTTDFLKNLIIT